MTSDLPLGNTNSCSCPNPRESVLRLRPTYYTSHHSFSCLRACFRLWNNASTLKPPGRHTLPLPCPRHPATFLQRKRDPSSGAEINILRTPVGSKSIFHPTLVEHNNATKYLKGHSSCNNGITTYINKRFDCRNKPRQHHVRSSGIAYIFVELWENFRDFFSLFYMDRIWLQRGWNTECIISRDLYGQHQCINTSIDGTNPGIPTQKEFFRWHAYSPGTRKRSWNFLFQYSQSSTGRYGRQKA